MILTKKGSPMTVRKAHWKFPFSQLLTQGAHSGDNLEPIVLLDHSVPVRGFENYPDFSMM